MLPLHLLSPPVNFERFNDKVRLASDEEVSIGKHQFEYLFLVWQSGTVYVHCSFSITTLCSGQCYVDVCKDGLCGASPVSLSNSVNMADTPRLKEISSLHPPMKLAKLLNGQLLLYKVFTGRGLEEMKEGNKLVSLFHLRHCVHECAAGGIKCQLLSRQPGSGLCQTVILSCQSTLFISLM